MTILAIPQKAAAYKRPFIGPSMNIPATIGAPIVHVQDGINASSHGRGYAWSRTDIMYPAKPPYNAARHDTRSLPQICF
jgi:hypothetical protein